MLFLIVNLYISFLPVCMHKLNTFNFILRYHLLLRNICDPFNFHSYSVLINTSGGLDGAFMWRVLMFLVLQGLDTNCACFAIFLKDCKTCAICIEAMEYSKDQNLQQIYFFTQSFTITNCRLSAVGFWNGFELNKGKSVEFSSIVDEISTDLPLSNSNSLQKSYVCFFLW
jgi:hypothetical protein